METVTRVCYCSREDAKSALDLFEVTRTNAQLDRAIQDASDNIDGAMHRKFFPEDTTRYFDWPNFQYAYPWRIWFEQYDLVVATAVTSGGQSISLGNLFFEPANKQQHEPFTYVEIDRSTNSAFGVGNTPQHDVAITGTWGYTAQATGAGILAVALTDTTGTSVQVSDSSVVGVGDLIIIDSERMLVQEKSFLDTTVAFSSLTASNANNVISVVDGTKFSTGEILLLDSERMLITDIAGNNLIVKRAFDGTILAVHTSGDIYAARKLTVERGKLGTTAATHLINAAVSRHVPPSLIRALCVAEALNTCLQETSGYSRTVGEGDNSRPASGSALSQKWAQAIRRYGRSSRSAVI